jgi:MFS family permease
MSSQGARRAILIALPFIDVLTEIGVASAFPQLRAAYGSAFRASLVVAVSPLFAVLTGWVWGALARRAPVTRVVPAAMLGWALVTIALGLAVGMFAVALVLRALQGAFSAGFAALPFIVFTRHAEDERERAKAFGTLETAVSAGAILAPVSVGTLLATAPQAVLTALGGAMLALLVPWVRAEGGARVAGRGAGAAPVPTHAAPVAGPTAGDLLPGPAIARRVLVPTAFAAGIALELGALETLIPTVVEDTFGSVLGGKVTTMAFELAVVAGILLKARWPAVGRRVPLALALVVGGAYAAAAAPEIVGARASALAAVGFMVLAGGPIGAAVTMGNEYAAARVEGAEDVGMGLYSTLRITGSFLGPLFMNIRYPGVLAALAVGAMVCAALVRRDAGTTRAGEYAHGDHR